MTKLKRQAVILLASGFSISFGLRYVRRKTECIIADSNLCKDGITMMLKQKLCVEALGDPIESQHPNLFHRFNKFDGKHVSIALPIKGSKSEGELLIDAFKGEKEAKKDMPWMYLSLKLKTEKETFVIVDQKVETPIDIQKANINVIGNKKVIL